MTALISELAIIMVIYAFARGLAGNSFAWGWFSAVSCVLILHALGLWPGANA